MYCYKEKPSLALVLGSGFSKEAHLPCTDELTEHFLTIPGNGVIDRNIEEKITCILRDYWEYVFSFTAGNHPTLEDHFTVLDLAANSGHTLGKYTPKKLRAIRRMSIHRLFQLLDLSFQKSDKIEKLLDELNSYFNVSVVTLNWDIVVEKHISGGVNYGIKIEPLDRTGNTSEADRILLLKVHGSSNWLYCDCCRKLFVGEGKSALHRNAYIELDDFALFGYKGDYSAEDHQRRKNNRKCKCCGGYVTGRVATFSFQKNFSISQFHIVWEKAYNVLCGSDNWLFIGYSMPEADFEFRHLLKSAQLARNNLSKWDYMAVLKDNAAAERYSRFFGISNIYQEGLSSWVENNLKEFCIKKGNHDTQGM